MAFEVKDSGERQQFTSGMVRDTSDNKVNYTLVLDGPMFQRWAEHLTKGAKKYSEGNWLKAEGEAELKRFRESALRHFIQWFRGETDEDHAAAVMFNINGAEYVKGKTNSVSGVTSPSRIVRWVKNNHWDYVHHLISGDTVQCICKTYSYRSELTLEDIEENLKDGEMVEVVA